MLELDEQISVQLIIEKIPILDFVKVQVELSLANVVLLAYSYLYHTKLH